jgi:hypothetical protein
VLARNLIYVLALLMCLSGRGYARDALSTHSTRASVAQPSIASASLVSSINLAGDSVLNAMNPSPHAAPILPHPVNKSPSLTKPDNKEHKNTGFLDFSLYPYTDADADNTATINALANLDNGFQYFSLTNFGRDPSRNELEEVKGILTEQNLRWKLPCEIPVAIAVQALIRSGNDNDALRLGPRWTIQDTWGFDRILKSCGLKYWIAFYGAQFDHASGCQWQMEHCFLWNVFPELLDNRVYIGGFADHNINHAGGTKSTWVEEAQLGVRLIGEWYFVTEQRYNGFRVGDESSVGVGLEYVIRFK